MSDLQREKERKEKWGKDWIDYWKPLLLTDGELDEQKIKNEMSDLVFIFEQVGEVYCHLTGNKLSKPMYYADTIITAHDDMVTELVNERVKEELESV